MYNAILIIIGNEILSGRTEDKNINYIARKLNDNGVHLREIRVIPDISETIIDNIKNNKDKYNYVLTTGGIGPTHDDITSYSISLALDKKYVVNIDALKILEDYYGNHLNEARKKMAYMPEGAELICNPISKAPGFIIENIYVMAGVPKIMQAMLDEIIYKLRSSKSIYSKIITTDITEGDLAENIGEIQYKYSNIELGSYPLLSKTFFGTSIVFRGTDEKNIDLAMDEVKNIISLHNGKILNNNHYEI